MVEREPPRPSGRVVAEEPSLDAEEGHEDVSDESDHDEPPPAQANLQVRARRPPPVGRMPGMATGSLLTSRSTFVCRFVAPDITSTLATARRP